jgi:FkbM family methyltransferase
MRALLMRTLRGSRIHHLARRWTGAAEYFADDRNSVYDRETVEVMRRVLGRDSSCADVGAHKGDILRHMVLLAPDGIHHAFEALPHLAKELRARFPGVVVHQVAVSDTNGRSDFQYVENDAGYSGLRRRIYDRADPKITTIQVSAMTLDEAIPAEQPIAFVKIDIEGGEYHALKGASNTIRRWHPVIVFEAGSRSTGQYGVTADDLFSLVTGLGYEVSTMRWWLDGRNGYSPDSFRHNWENGPDYYFIATPGNVTS